ncbi:MAG TPA: hypothetical protein VM621_04235 [Luteibacter sp.]|uniref:hypothetical protein n=1 Tax=Luteibacter sp. TaxID=1886636 RepID=UPI002B7FC4CC|nr:hypothetical protein [Luteibacter sp.]HVI54250.1 hypothetical protein [Luteibacter sp.]
MKSMPRLVSFLVVSFAAASAFAADASPSVTRTAQSVNATVQTAVRSGSAPRADMVKCTNPRECSVG